MYISQPDAARKYGVSLSMIKRYVNSHWIRVVKDGQSTQSRLYIYEADLVDSLLDTKNGKLPKVRSKGCAVLCLDEALERYIKIVNQEDITENL